MDTKNSAGDFAGFSASFAPPPFKMIFQTAKGEHLGELSETDAGTLKFEGKAEESAKQLFDHLVLRHSRTLSSADERIKAMIEKLSAAMPETLEGCALNVAAPTFPKTPVVTFENLAKMADDLRAYEECARDRQIRELAEHMWAAGWRDPSGDREGFVSAMRAVLTLWDDRKRSANLFDAINIPMPSMPRGFSL
ncbi:MULTISPECIES: hypothetical protein [Pseudomonas]|uniref:hypothetical protein n=1 Tax=Pseudomonas TaxID=286 RepID=UPI00076179BB|nr:MULTISPECIES: hypothetical protein [Pseudomonas]MDG9809491.1 hypothetical protein [Pseudomonas juntendi]MDG9815737.1 hypothetical protein [Pseudomonas putida]